LGLGAVDHPGGAAPDGRHRLRAPLEPLATRRGRAPAGARPRLPQRPGTRSATEPDRVAGAAFRRRRHLLVRDEIRDARVVVGAGAVRTEDPDDADGRQGRDQAERHRGREPRATAALPANVARSLLAAARDEARRGRRRDGDGVDDLPVEQRHPGSTSPGLGATIAGASIADPGGATHRPNGRRRRRDIARPPTHATSPSR